MDINISDIKDRDMLLEELWNNSKPALFFKQSGMPSPQFDLIKAKQSLDHSGYADYICGRVIKSNIYESDVVSSWGYDRDNGQGAFEKVVNKLREKL